MSASSQVALLATGPRQDATARVSPAGGSRAGGLRLISFIALGLFGVLSWATLLSGSADELRLLGVLALAAGLAGAGLVLPRRLVLALGLPVLAMALVVAGIPVSWILHLRVAVTVSAISDGLSALPRLLVPYVGVNPWVRSVLVLGAAVLALDAAVLFVLAPRAGGPVRRLVAALPLVALATIPATVVHPRFAYLNGLVLFGLLAAYVWGDRVDRHQALAAVGLCACAAAAAMIIAPGLDRHRPWISYESIAGGLSPTSVRFDWRQRYGPVTWPRSGQTVLEVQAPRGDYWKAESLDAFDGRSWTSATAASFADELAGVHPANLRRWTQTLRVTLGAMSTSQIIGAGDAISPPSGIGAQLLSGTSPGTWVTQTALGRGDSYLLRVYDPVPSSRELSAAGTAYPQSLALDYLTVSVPALGLAAPHAETPPAINALIPPFGSSVPSGFDSAAASASAALRSSPYARAYELARRLAQHAGTPYAYVRAVERYLAHGYTYSESPPAARYPLEDFLFKSRAGYCQQFAGAMALLLRLGGVPARLAVGFTTGAYDSASGQWRVTDSDAHAWVEAFFPGDGWVRFDPTPAADPALGGALTSPITGASPTRTPATSRSSRGGLGSLGVDRGSSRPRAGATGPSVTLLVLGGLAVLAALALALRASRPAGEGAAGLRELERAYARTGRRVEPSTTLAELEGRLAGSPVAQSYLRALSLQRFAGVPGGPTVAQRRALRRALRRGLGMTGWVRAWWALPPRRGG